MDSYIQVSVSVPGHEPFGFKLKVKNVYGVMKRADDPRKVFKNLIASALARHFGGQSVTVESSYALEPASTEAVSEDLAVAYKAKFGRRPHPAMDPEKLRQAVA